MCPFKSSHNCNRQSCVTRVSCRQAGKKKFSTPAPDERRKGVPWSEEEHRLFLQGLEIYGKGDWRSISRKCVLTRNPTQACSVRTLADFAVRVLSNPRATGWRGAALRGEDCEGLQGLLWHFLTASCPSTSKSGCTRATVLGNGRRRAGRRSCVKSRWPATRRSTSSGSTA